MKVAKQDNQYFAMKVALRQTVMRQAGLREQLVCETHGGMGRLWGATYRGMPGMVCEQADDRIVALTIQRPTWRVYQCHAEQGLAGGLGGDLAFTVLDCDPYGAPWATLQGFFASKRLFAPVMAVAITDGSRQKQRLGGLIYGWEPWQEQYGAGLWAIYLRCCQERFAQIVAQARYIVTWWHGRYGGHTGQMTYWGAVLRQPSARHSDEAPQVVGG